MNDVLPDFPEQPEDRVAMLATLADAYAFLGNSLLSPLSQTADVGLDAAFWVAFPSFGVPGVTAAADALARWAERDAAGGRPRDERTRDVSVEYTRLFIGPPKPAAPPWETMNRGDGVTVGFGEPTFEMRRLLREAGLELANSNHQYEDHLGIELLYLSELCRRAAAEISGMAEGEERMTVELSGRAAEDGVGCRAAADSAGAAMRPAEVGPGAEAAERARAFATAHPGAWVGAFAARVAEAAPDGYYAGLLALARELLTWQAGGRLA